VFNHRRGGVFIKQRIGMMNIEVILEGAQTQAMADIRKAIYRILYDEKG
jgi:hypothetical protein